MIADRPIGSAANDGDDVAGLHVTVEHADFVARRQDVGQHEQLLVGRHPRARIRRRVCERHSHVFGLGAVDHVSEDPSAAAEALSVPALSAEPARAARGDARHEDAIADPDGLDGRADRLDRADCFMSEDSAVGDCREIAFEDVEIGTANGGG